MDDEASKDTNMANDDAGDSVFVVRGDESPGAD